ncbi:hypothetical protein MRS44_018123 [Fusarium solani]|uniref:uncharacterized protein n=1 Tax=Fusarium solani TaxID=169388 RepID=UPI0032C40D5F|nr:hypothetical protein MRS44_018123 [Fusarium solani]
MTKLAQEKNMVLAHLWQLGGELYQARVAGLGVEAEIASDHEDQDTGAADGSPLGRVPKRLRQSRSPSSSFRLDPSPSPETGRGGCRLIPREKAPALGDASSLVGSAIDDHVEDASLLTGHGKHHSDSIELLQDAVVAGHEPLAPPTVWAKVVQQLQDQRAQLTDDVLAALVALVISVGGTPTAKILDTLWIQALIVHYDSLWDSARETRVEALLQRLFHQALPASQFRFSSGSCPQQSDSVNCGVFVLAMLSCLLNNEAVPRSINVVDVRRRLVSLVPKAATSPGSQPRPAGATHDGVERYPIPTTACQFPLLRHFPQTQTLRAELEKLTALSGAFQTRRVLFNTLSSALDHTREVERGGDAAIWSSKAEQLEWKAHIDSLQALIDLSDRRFNPGVIGDSSADEVEHRLRAIEEELRQVECEANRADAVDSLRDTMTKVEQAFGLRKD